MTDIVERLDKMLIAGAGIYPKEVREARNEIERLRAALKIVRFMQVPWQRMPEIARRAFGEWHDEEQTKQAEEIERLREINADLLAALKDIVKRNEIQHWFNLDLARTVIAKAEGS